MHSFRLYYNRYCEFVTLHVLLHIRHFAFVTVHCVLLYTSYKHYVQDIVCSSTEQYLYVAHQRERMCYEYFHFGRITRS